MKTGKQPGQFKRLADSYRPLLAAILAIFFALPALSQYDSTKKAVPQQSYGFSWKNGFFRNSLVIPNEGQLQPRALKDTGAIAYYRGKQFIWALRNGILDWFETGGETSITYDFPSIYIDSLGADEYLIKILQLIKDSAGVGGLPTQYNGQDTANIIWYNLKQYIIRARGQSWQESLIKVDSAGAYVLGNDSVVIGGRFDTGRVVIRFRGMESASNGDSILALNTSGNLIKVAKADLFTAAEGLSKSGTEFRLGVPLGESGGEFTGDRQINTNGYKLFVPKFEGFDFTIGNNFDIDSSLIKFDIYGLKTAKIYSQLFSPYDSRLVINASGLTASTSDDNRIDFQTDGVSRFIIEGAGRINYSTWPLSVSKSNLQDSALIILRTGNTSYRNSISADGINGRRYLFFNTDSSRFEGYNGTTWRGIAWTGEGGGSGTVTTGYGLLGNGSGGNPVRVDSATLRGDYIRNQIAGRENKNAFINIVRADSIYTPKLTLGAYAQDNIRPIFRGIDSGSTGGYEGYLYQREGYANRIVDLIRRANGSYQSPTTTAKGNAFYSFQIESRGASQWLSAITPYNILAKTNPIAGSTLTQGIAHSWSLRNSGYLGMFFDSTGLRIGIDTFSVNGDAKSTIDLLGSFGKRFRSVAGTGESAEARDNTIYITATFDYTLTLPDARLSPRREYVIKRVDTLLTKAVIKPFSGQKIDRQDSIVLFRNQSYVVASDSTGWQIIAGRETTLHQDEWKARNGISYFQEFISNTAFSDGYLVPTSNGTGAGVGRTGNIPVALRATNRVGVTAYRTGTTTTGRAGYVSDLNIGENLVLGGGITVFETTVAFPNLSDGTDRYQALFGFGDAPSSVNQSDGIYFLYDEGGVSTGSTASANWQVATVAGGSRTITATSIPVAANQWYRLRIELNFNATRVYFYIDGNLVGQTTLTIPSGTGGNGTNFLNQIYKSAGTTDRIALVDYLLFNMRFNTPRY
ncbi:hypothetical protein Pan5_18 [Pseudanabaena phage Pan5]|nr:hypothetical protein Pan5_18 [Pseudanabaena phage Pan5]